MYIEQFQLYIKKKTFYENVSKNDSVCSSLRIIILYACDRVFECFIYTKI